MTAPGRAPRSNRWEVVTPAGVAVVDLDLARGPTGVLMLGHGAGGGVDAPDLLATREAASNAGFVVARVTQPYRVAGRRSPAPAARLDEAWLAVAAALRRRRGFARLPFVYAGRSSGARVACRTAGVGGAAAVLALAFPLHPPGRPDRSRLAELALPDVPVLVVQGERDAFGVPPAARGRAVVVLPRADHALRGVRDAISAAVTTFLDGCVDVGGFS